MEPGAEQLEKLAQQRLIWRGREASSPVTPCASGWPELDRQLGGGLPSSGVVTIQSPTGIGELRLLWPFFQSETRLLVFIAPPYPLDAESLQGAGLDLARVLIIQPKNDREALWAAEQSLKSGACQAVCLWQKRVALVQARRLQLAAREGHSTHFLFLSAPRATQGLPVDLCLELSAHPQGINVSVPRRKQGWALPRFTLSMTEAWPELSVKPHRTNRPVLSLVPTRTGIGAEAS